MSSQEFQTALYGLCWAHKLGNTMRCGLCGKVVYLTSACGHMMVASMGSQISGAVASSAMAELRAVISSSEFCSGGAVTPYSTWTEGSTQARDCSTGIKTTGGGQ